MKLSAGHVSVLVVSTSDSRAARHGEIVAICDIDDGNLNKAADKWPKAKKFLTIVRCSKKLPTALTV